MQKRGRPRKEKKLRLLTIDSALQLLKEYWLSRGVSAEDVEKIIPAKGTIYNKISSSILTNHGPRGVVLLDESELIEKLCS
jgi:hypothetical protein